MAAYTPITESPTQSKLEQDGSDDELCPRFSRIRRRRCDAGCARHSVDSEADRRRHFDR